MQRIWRGKLGRDVALGLRQRLAASMLMQAHMRRKMAQTRFYKMQAEHQRHEASTKISSLVRGHFGRVIYRYRARKKYHREVVVPSAMKLQASWRALQTRRWYYDTHLKVVAGLKIQAYWRGIQGQREVQKRYAELAFAYKTKLAVRLQSAFRGHKGRLKAQMVARERDADRIRATMRIQAFVRSCAEARKRREIRDAEVVRIHWDRMAEIGEEIDWIKEDIKDVLEDREVRYKYMKKIKKHVKQLKKFRREAERRIPVVEHEIENLTEDDIQHGWADAYETEWDTLTNRLGMATEEVELKNAQHEAWKAETEILSLELDDLDMDLDEQMEARVMQYQRHRHEEVKRCQRLFENHRKAIIRRQKNRWKIRDVRTRVIAQARKQAREDVLNEQRLKGDEAVMPWDAPLERSLDDMQTISHKKNVAFEARASTHLEAAKFRKRLGDMQDVKTAGQGNAAIRAAYDGVVEGAQTVVDKLSYDVRRQVRPQIELSQVLLRVWKSQGAMHMRHGR